MNLVPLHARVRRLPDANVDRLQELLHLPPRVLKRQAGVVKHALLLPPERCGPSMPAQTKAQHQTRARDAHAAASRRSQQAVAIRI